MRNFSRHLQCFGFSVLKLQCNLKMLDFQPTLALLLTHQMRSKCKNPLHVIWYNPWLPEKPLFTHMIFSKWTSEIFGSGRTNNPIVGARGRLVVDSSAPHLGELGGNGIGLPGQACSSVGPVQETTSPGNSV